MNTRGNLGDFERLILMASLRLGENAYGATIMKEIYNRTGREVSVGAVYTALNRLEEKGFISSQLGEPTPERGGRAKRFITISPLGRHVLQTVESQFERLRPKPKIAEA